MNAEIRALTGLRGAAACLVMAYHYTAGGAGFGPLAPLVGRGYQAVDLFFVLSGFVMALTYGRAFAAGLTAGGYGRFLLRRLGRVYPLYVLVTLASLATAAPAPGAVSVVSNLLLVQGWGVADSIGGPTWSISTELAAYMAFPALLLVATRGPAVTVMLACLGTLAWVAGQDAASLHQVASRNGPLDVFGGGTVFPLLRCLAGFLLGVLACRAMRSGAVARWAAAPGAADAVLIAVVMLMAWRGSDVMLVLAVVPLVMALSAGRSVTAWCLGSPALHWLGTVSYSIYLVHRPLESLVRPALSTALGKLQVPHAFTVSAALMGALAIIVSGVTFRLVEEPGRLWSRRLLQPRTPAPARDAPASTLAGRFSA